MTSPVYSLGTNTDSFLVDGTGGAVPQPNWRQALHGVTSASLLQAQVNAVQALITQVQEAPLRAELNAMLGVTGEMSSSGTGGVNTPSGLDYGTNLWLEIQAVTNGAAYVILHNVQAGEIYELMSKVALTDPVWNPEQVLFAVANQDWIATTVPVLDRANALFFWARDWTGIDENANGIADWWEWENFGNLSQNSADDYDGDGINNGLEYTNYTEPNTIAFSMVVAGHYTNGNSVNIPLNITGGVPASMAVLVNSTDFGSVAWLPYSSSNVLVALNAGDGDYAVWIGLRGRQNYSQQTWRGTTITRDTVSPGIWVTNPASITIFQPMIQLQGYVSETLASFTYDLANAAGIMTNQLVFITGAHPDTNTWKFTTNYFQAYDVALTSGANTITLHATDQAGNVTTSNFCFTVDYTDDNTAPNITVNWPQNNDSVAGSSFTLSGTLDDATASVIVSSGSGTNPAVMKRSGKFYVQNLPLPNTTNTFTLTATDVETNSRTISLTVLRSPVAVSVNPLTTVQLSQPFVTVTGAINDSSKKLRVNGVDATVNSNGTWEADNVPMNDDEGAGQFDVAIYPSGSDPDNTTPDAKLVESVLLPPVVRVTGYTEDYLHIERGTFNGTLLRTRNRTWKLNAGGNSWQHYAWPDYFAECDTLVAWPTNWPNGQNLDGSIACQTGNYGETTISAWHNCDVLVTYTSHGVLDDLITPWAGWNTIARVAQTEIELVAGDSNQSGATQLIRLTASAAAYTNRLEDIGLNPLWINETTFDGSGTIPLPATSLQILGQTLTPTATNANVGEMYVLMPAGGKRELPFNIIGGTNYSFDVNAEAVTLRIFNGTNDVTGQTNPPVIVGQQINLSCALSLTNATPTSFQWTVPGQTVKTYEHVFLSQDTYTVKENLSSADLESNAVVFYWINGGTNFDIESTVMLDGTTASAKARFVVERPVSAFTSQTTTNNPSQVLVVENDTWWLRFGTNASNYTPGQEGISLYGSVTTTENGAGAFGYVQLVDISRRWIDETNGLAWKRQATNCLDPNLFQSVGYQVQIGNSETRTNNPSDSPGEPESEDYLTKRWISANDSFNGYLVYKPVGTNSIWVTLKKIRWGWSGAATKTNGAWNLDFGSPANPANPVGEDSVELPTWRGYGTAVPNVLDN